MPPFRLIPFPTHDLPKIEVGGHALRAENRLGLRYEVRGEVESLLIPAPAAPARRDGLWAATCFEAFLALPGQPAYWEFNLSPSGEWNVYHMQAYRQVGFREEPAFSHLPFAFQQNDRSLSLDLTVDLAPIVAPGQSIQLGLTAVIQTRDGRDSYWALAHPGDQADYHRRESFILTL